MSHRLAAFVIAAVTCSAVGAYAQDTTTTPAAIEITYVPAAVAVFTSERDASSFGTYGFGGAVTFNVDPFVGFEGEASAMIATVSDLQFGDLRRDVTAPNLLNYSASLVVSPFGRRTLVPYATLGLGGLTMFERQTLEMSTNETFLSTSVGGGVKWYAPNGRWGLRADYRYSLTKAKDDAPEFFGDVHRSAHRAYCGVILGAGR